MVVGRDSVWSTELDVSPGDTVLVKLSIVNEAEPDLNDYVGRRGIAIDTRVAIGYTDAASSAPLMYGTVTAANAQPRWVARAIVLNASSPVRLVPESASGQLSINGITVGELPNFAFVADADDASEIAAAGASVSNNGVSGEFRATVQ